MKFVFVFLLSQSILLPIITGLIRFRRLDKGYQPFFLLLLIGFLTELFSFVTMQVYKTNFPVVNIYILIEWIFIAWQFHVWGFLRQRKGAFYSLLILTSLFWIGEYLWLHQFTAILLYFRLLYFSLIVLLSINKINFMITHDNRNLFQNPKFLICIGFIIYFIYMIVYFWSFQISLFGKSDITGIIIFLMAYVNVFTNIIYAIAFLLIPAPQKFTLE
ncbi:MAG TPA: hypothetical protein VL832_16105 [Puia sp.]|nr:hypothetical protein [Puia sp.]